MKPNKIIKKSIYYYNLKKYSDAIKLLEKQIFFFNNDYFYHYLLGLSYLRIGNLPNAQTYLKRAYTLNPSNPDVKQAIAILLLAQKKEDRAIQIWLKLIEDQEEVERSELSLETTRKNPIEGKLLLNSKAYEKLFPEIKIKLNIDFVKYIKRFIIFGFILLFILILGSVIRNYSLSIPQVLNKSSNKKSNDISAYIDTINIDSKEKIKNNEGQFIFILTSDEIKNSFEKIKKYLKSGSDNFARIEINKVMNSNASESIKLKAKNLASFIAKPDFISFDDYLNLADIKKNPFIYDGVYVKWEGVANNIEKKDNEMYFDFYIGYNKNVLDGIVLTKASFDIDIESKDQIEILGQLEYEKGSLLLNAVTIRKIK